MSDSLWPCGLLPTRLLCPWNFPVRNTRVGCPFLLQGILPTQGSNLPLLRLVHWQVGSLPLVCLWSVLGFVFNVDWDSREYDLCDKCNPLSGLEINFHKNMPSCLCIAYDCFQATIAKLKSYDRARIAYFQLKNF